MIAMPRRSVTRFFIPLIDVLLLLLLPHAVKPTTAIATSAALLAIRLLGVMSLLRSGRFGLALGRTPGFEVALSRAPGDANTAPTSVLPTRRHRLVTRS